MDQGPCSDELFTGTGGLRIDISQIKRGSQQNLLPIYFTMMTLGA